MGKCKKVVQSLLNRKVNNIRINLGIVRGLDYYSGIVFEAIILKVIWVH